MVDIEVLNVNVDLMVIGFDDDGVNEMALGLDEVLRLLIGIISTPNAPTHLHLKRRSRRCMKIVEGLVEFESKGLDPS